MTEQDKHQAKLRELHLIEEARLTFQKLYNQGAAVMGGTIALGKTGEAGKSVLMLLNIQGEWGLGCAVWPQTSPSSDPYLTDVIETGITLASTTNQMVLPMDSTGYMVIISTEINSITYNNVFFVDGVGALIEKSTVVGTISHRHEEGLFTGFTYLDQAGKAGAKLWSGGQVFTHSFLDATALPSWNASGISGDDCTLDGTTTLRYDSANGEQTWMLNATTGAKYNITQHLVHSNSVGQSTRVAAGLRMYGNYLYMAFRPQVEPKAIYASIRQDFDYVTVLDFFGTNPRVGQGISAPEFPQGTVITAINGNTITLSQAATADDINGGIISLTGEFVDILRIIKTDGTVTEKSLYNFNIRYINEIVRSGRYNLIIDAVESGHPTIPGWVIVYSGQNGILLPESIDMATHNTFQILSSVDPQEFETGLADPNGVDYATMIVHGGSAFNGKMLEFSAIKFLWVDPTATQLHTWEPEIGSGEFFGLYHNGTTEPMSRQMYLASMPSDNTKATLIEFGTPWDPSEVLADGGYQLPTAYANLASNSQASSFQVRALGSTHVLVVWQDLSRSGDTRGYRILKRSTSLWNGQPLWLNPTGDEFHTSGSTLLINDTINGNSYYWVPAINNGNAAINALDTASFINYRIVNEGYPEGIGSYNYFQESGVMLAITSPTEAWLIKNQVGQTSTWIQLSGTNDWTAPRITYDLIAVANQVNGNIQIQVLNLAGQSLYTISTGLPNLDLFITTGNRVVAKVSDVGLNRYFYISASGYIYKDTDYGFTANDWRLENS